MKIAVVSPHRDDAAFWLALTVGDWVSAGHKVSVLNCFSRSGTAPYAEMDFVHANDRMSFVTALRGREDESWRRQYGTAVTLVDLNMKDAPLRLHIPASEVFGLVVNPNDKALVKIQKAVERVGGAAVVPLGLGGHIDHIMARAACVAMAEGETPVAFYEDAAGVEDDVVREAIGTMALTPVLVGGGDVEVAVARKKKAVFCYDSQIDDAEVDRIANACRKFEGRERLWVNAAWMESGLVVA